MSDKNVERQVREMGRDIVLMLKDVKLKNGFEVDGVAINSESNAFQFHGYSFHNGDVEELIVEGELDCVKDFADDIKGFYVLEDADLIITDYEKYFPSDVGDGGGVGMVESMNHKPATSEPVSNDSKKRSGGGQSEDPRFRSFDEKTTKKQLKQEVADNE